ncbi:hypothetical protein Hanom_Chr05g00422371 [Helianthus anomalus]
MDPACSIWLRLYKFRNRRHIIYLCECVLRNCNHVCLNTCLILEDNCRFLMQIVSYIGNKYLLYKQSIKWITVMTLAPPRLEKGGGMLDKPVTDKTTPDQE